MTHPVLETMSVVVNGLDIAFPLAKRISEELVASVIVDPILVAWRDGKKGEEHPTVFECRNKPGWLAYAEGHGGRVRIDVNNGDFSFIFADISEV